MVRQSPRSAWDAPEGVGWGSVDVYWPQYFRWFLSLGVAPVAPGRHRRKRLGRHLSGEMHSLVLESLEWFGRLLIASLLFATCYWGIVVLTWL